MTLVFDNVNDKLFVTKTVSPNEKDPIESFNNAKKEIINLTKRINRTIK